MPPTFPRRSPRAAAPPRPLPRLDALIVFGAAALGSTALGGCRPTYCIDPVALDEPAHRPWWAPIGRPIVCPARVPAEPATRLSVLATTPPAPSAIDGRFGPEHPPAPPTIRGGPRLVTPFDHEPHRPHPRR